MVTAPDELALNWQAHFASIEAGDLISPALLRASCLTRQSIQRPPLFDVQPEDLPTLPEVERAARSLNKKKATGPVHLLHRIVVGSSARTISSF